MVLFYDVLCQSQPDARTLEYILFLLRLVISLIETCKDQRGVLSGDTHAGIRYADIHIIIGYRARYTDLSTVVRELKGVRQEVEKHFLHQPCIEPAKYLRLGQLECVSDVPLLGIVRKREIDFFQESHDVLPHQMKGLVVLLQFAELQQFGYQVTQILCVFPDFQDRIVDHR